MSDRKLLNYLRLCLVLTSVVFASACSTKYEGEDFTWSAPMGFKTKEFEPSGFDPSTNSEMLIFSQKGHLYFEIFREKIPAESDLVLVFEAYKSNTSGMYSHYQFISQKTVDINNRTAIEYVHREFIGEPYEQTRELWMENNGWAYALRCTNPADATPGAIIPVVDQCFQLAENFQFK
jgi:hypothetical protein